MRIITYKNHIDKDQKNYLVKEQSINYTSISTLDKPEKIHEIMKNVFEMDKSAVEMTYLICTNTKCKPISFILLSKGTVNSSLLSTRDIFIQAILSSAVNIFICHNHPSQDITPSKQDIIITKKIAEAAKIMDIQFLDHIIITTNKYFSFKENNLL